jgi:hypothetical protein
MEKVKDEMGQLSNQKVIQLLTVHDSEISALSKRTEALQSDISNISDKLDTFYKELTTILNRPVLSVSSSLTVIKDVGLIVGLIVGGIVYVASSSYEARIAIIEEKNRTGIEVLKDQIKELKGIRSQ